ncbi:MAG TPA: hypothetical protein VLG28_05240 [Acidimicrobiia bacterium]|nr:hypothetical protein [Acidimicrobiia bacterium]
MPSSPYVAAALIAVSSATAAVHLAVAPDPFAPSSAAVIALGAVLGTIITVVGLVLVRGRWARQLGMVLAGGLIAVAAVADDFDAWAVLTVLLGLASLGVLAGRWLDGWIRGRPSATGPPPQSVLLLLGLLGLVPLVGLASPSGLETAHGMLGAGGILLAWGFGQAQVWALWAMRLVLPVLVIFAALATPIAGAVALLAYGAALTWLSWTEEVRLSVQPLLDVTPGPRRIRGADENGAS